VTVFSNFGIGSGNTPPFLPASRLLKRGNPRVECVDLQPLPYTAGDLYPTLFLPPSDSCIVNDYPRRLPPTVWFFPRRVSFLLLHCAYNDRQEHLPLTTLAYGRRMVSFESAADCNYDNELKFCWQRDRVFRFNLFILSSLLDVFSRL